MPEGDQELQGLLWRGLLVKTIMDVNILCGALTAAIFMLFKFGHVVVGAGIF